MWIYRRLVDIIPSCFFILLLMATIHAAMLGATIIAKEERDKTSEFLFVKASIKKYHYYRKIIGSIYEYCGL